MVGSGLLNAGDDLAMRYFSFHFTSIFSEYLEWPGMHFTMLLVQCCDLNVSHFLLRVSEANEVSICSLVLRRGFLIRCAVLVYDACLLIRNHIFSLSVKYTFLPLLSELCLSVI